jgi:uncharacterized membrane protein
MAGRIRLMIAIIVAVVVGVLISAQATWRFGLPIGLAVLGIVYVAWTWAILWPFDGSQTRAHAQAEEPGRLVSHLLVVVFAFGSLASVAVLLLGNGSRHRDLQAAVALLNCAVAWFSVQTIFTALYGVLFYADSAAGLGAALTGKTPGGDVGGGIDFAGTEVPSYRDFAYVAFTMGMCFQVSDTGFRDSTMRTAGLQHALLSYVFGTVVIATLINFVAGLGG